MSSVVINEVLPYTQTIAAGSQTVFDTNWTADVATDVQVYARATGIDANDATQLVSTVSYNVTFVGAGQFVRVTFLAGRTLNDVITITRLTPSDRENLYINTNFTPSMLNGDFGRLVMIDQQNELHWMNLAPRYNTSASLNPNPSYPTADIILPQLAARGVWRKNVGNTAIEAVDVPTIAELASHDLPYGATMIGLHPSGTVQDMANAKFLLQVPDVTMPNAQAMSALDTGIVRNNTSSGVQQISIPLSSLDVVGMALDKMAYGDGPDSYALTDLTPFARTLLADADATAARATLEVPSSLEAFLIANNLSEGVGATKRANLGLTIGTDVQAYDATLQSLSALGTAADKVAYTTGVDTWAEVTATAYSRGLWAGVDLAAWQVALGIPGGGGAYFAIANNLSEGVPATIRTNIGLVIGTDVQAYDPTLQSLSALGTASDKIAYTTGVDTWAETGITSLGRSLIDDATQADMNTTIGSVPLAGGTMTGALLLSGSPTVGSQAATKDYVDSLSQNDEIACLCMTETDQLAAWTYNNGVLGVGATITSNVNGATTFDGVVPVDTNRILVNLQTANTTWQGAYTIVQGTGGTPTVLTRATDYDVPAEITAGDVFAVVQGTLYGASQWMNSQIINPVIIGTTPITFTQLAGMGSLLKANNLSDLPSAATARTNLGLAIGVNVQAYDATLQSISGLGTAANKMIYTTALDTWAEADITALGRTLMADATAANMRTTLGLVIGTNVQAYDAGLNSIAGLTTVANNMLYTTALDTYAVITPGNSSVMVSSVAGVPSWSTDLPTAVTIGTKYIYRADGTDVPVADGGTGVSSTTAYGLMAGGTTTTAALQNIGAGTSGQTVVSQGASALPTFASMYINRNVIPAGNFDTNPWQRGTTLSIASGAPTYLADRFRFLNLVGTTGVVTFSRSADAPTVANAGMLVNNCLMIAVTTIDAALTAGDAYVVQHFVEGYDFAQIAQRAMTLSFWCKHTKTGTYCIGLGNAGGDRYYIAEYTQSVSDTWEKKTINITASTSAGTWDYTNGVGLTINFVMAVGSTYQGSANAWTAGNAIGTSNQVNAMDNVANRFRLALIQLEAGSIATPFEIKSRQEVLDHCQRYTWVINNQTVTFGTGYAYTTSTAYLWIPLPVQMRIAPTTASVSAVGDFTVLYGNSLASVLTTYASSNYGLNSFLISCTVTGAPLTAGAGVMIYRSGANGLLTVSAEF
jgi:hypothetical protein